MVWFAGWIPQRAVSRLRAFETRRSQLEDERKELEVRVPLLFDWLELCVVKLVLSPS